MVPTIRASNFQLAANHDNQMIELTIFKNSHREVTIELTGAMLAHLQNETRAAFETVPNLLQWGKPDYHPGR